MRDRYLVWNPARGMPTITHYTESSAIAEAERLAKANPGERFLVMSAIGVAVVEAPRVFHRYEPNDQTHF